MRVESQGGVARVTLMLGAAGALGSGAVQELRAAIAALDADPGCRVIVLTSAEPRFSSGFDLLEVGSAVMAGDARPAQDFAECLLTVARASQPVIAVVDGMAAAGSVGLIAACDIVIASARARFQLPEVTIGMLPILIAPYLERRISPARLRYMALSSRAIDAAEARLFGLVDEIAEGDLEQCVERQVRRILRSSPEALTECKRQLACSRADADATVARLADWLRRPGIGEAISDFSEGYAPAWFAAAGKEHSGSGEH